MNICPTEQECFWVGAFGDEYTERCRNERSVMANRSLFSSIFKRASYPIKTVLELGANIGQNMIAIRDLLSDVKLSGVEINKHAAQSLRKLQIEEVYEQSIHTYAPTRKYDFVFTKAVLIHISPEHLMSVYDMMANASGRYICLAEYYSPTPVEVEYRGHSGKLFKRDFAGELMERHPELKLVDYGFVYHRDAHFPKDDITWFLMEKR